MGQAAVESGKRGGMIRTNPRQIVTESDPRFAGGSVQLRRRVTLAGAALSALLISSVALAQNGKSTPSVGGKSVTPIPGKATSSIAAKSSSTPNVGTSLSATQKKLAKLREEAREAREKQLRAQGKEREEEEEEEEGEEEEAGEFYESIIYYLQMRVYPGDRLNELAYARAGEHVQNMPPATFMMKAPAKGVATPLANPTIGGFGDSIINGGQKWEFIGPKRLVAAQVVYAGPAGSFVSGRVNDVAYDPNTFGTVYCTGAQGGVWRSSDNGATWTCLTNADNFPKDPNVDSYAQYTSAVAVHPTNSNIIYAGTGDYDGGSGAARAGGLYRTVDRGASWDRIPAERLPNNTINPEFTKLAQQNVSGIAVDPTNPNIIQITTTGGLWRTTDGGVTWARATVTPAANWSSIDYSAPNGAGGRLYVASAIATGIFFSTNQGANWTQINNIPLAFNTPANPAGGLGLRVAASKVQSNVIYVFDASASSLQARILRGTLNGNTWSWVDITTTFPGNAGPASNLSQASYDLYMKAAPSLYQDANGDVRVGDTVFGGAITLAAGRAVNVFNTPPDISVGPNWSDITFTLTPEARLHADQHSFAYNPMIANEGIAANDGGVYRINWSRTSNIYLIDTTMNATLGITQFYKADWDNVNPNMMIGGTQDNQTPQAAATLANWNNVGGGDGGGCAINTENRNVQYATSQGGTIYRTTNLWANTGLIAQSSDWGNTNVVTQASSAPFVGTVKVGIGPAPAPSTSRHWMYFGTQYVWRWDETAGGWLSDTSMPPKRKPMGDQKVCADTSFVSAIAVAPKDLLNSNGSVIASVGNVVYSGSQDGQIWVTTNALNPDTAAARITWTRIDNATLTVSPIQSISVNPNNAADILVTLGNGQVWRCSNTLAGAALRFTNQSGFGAASLPPGVSTNDLSRDPVAPESTWYVATDVGVFVTTDSGSSWQNATKPLGLPNVQCTAIEAAERAPNGHGYLQVATFGRGMWRIALPGPLDPNFAVTTAFTRSATAPTITLNSTLSNTGGQANDVVITSASLTTDLGIVVNPTAGQLPRNIGQMPTSSTRPATFTYSAASIPRGTAVTLRMTINYTGGVYVLPARRIRIP